MKPWEVIPKSKESAGCQNYICLIRDTYDLKPNPAKSLIAMHVGDPTFYAGLEADKYVTDALHEAIDSSNTGYYANTTGTDEAKQAVADLVSTPEDPITSDKVFMTFGCTHALYLAIATLANPGDNILLSRPGYCIYKTHAQTRGIDCRLYNLRQDKGWEIDLEHLEAQIDRRTAALVVTNPSNPCGAVFSKKHLEDILKLANEYRIPIIADEVYGSIVFGGAKFYPLASLEPKVPILMCSSLAKSHVVPGWRLGWLVVYNRFGVLDDVLVGIRQLTQNLLGPSVPIQAALPAILRNTKQEQFDKICEMVESNAAIVMKMLSKSPYLTPIQPHGALYMMVEVKINKLKGIKDDFDFMIKLLAEESVWILPGNCFDWEGAFRITLLPRNEEVKEGCQRIIKFCEKYSSTLLLQASNMPAIRQQESSAATRRRVSIF